MEPTKDTKKVTDEEKVKAKELADAEKAVEDAREELRLATAKLVDLEEKRPEVTIEGARGAVREAEAKLVAAKSKAQELRSEVNRDAEEKNTALITERQREVDL